MICPYCQRQIPSDSLVCGYCGHKIEETLQKAFTGEGFTLKNTRHCVNSVSLVFEPDERLIAVGTL